MYKFLCASFTACRHILYFQNLFNVILFHHIAEFEFPKNQTIQTTGRYLFCCFIFEDSAFNKMLVNRQKKLLVAFHFELYLCRQPQPVICIYSICQQNLPTQMVRKLFCRIRIINLLKLKSKNKIKVYFCCIFDENAFKKMLVKTKKNISYVYVSLNFI